MSTDRFPLSPAAARLWTLSRIRPGDPFFNHPFAVDVAGPLDVDLLGRCLTAIVARHEPLRSRVADGMHVVEPATPVELSVVDGVEEDGDRFGQRPFDLAAGPPFEVLLLRLAPDRHRLVVNVHHIVIDGLSLDVFMTELVTLYGGGELPDLPVRFGDLPAAGDDREYWTRRLAGAPAVVDLPTAGPRPMATDHRGARRTRLIPSEVVDRVRQVARRVRATPYMALKAACDVVLAHYGNDDVLMGMALSGRDSTAHAGLIGYLVKPVVLRTGFHDDPTFTEVVRQVRNDVLDAHEHPDLPLEDVLSALAVVRDPSHHPVFQVMFTHSVAPAPQVVGGTTFTRRDMRLESLKVELTFVLTETPQGLEAAVDYRVDLFDESIVDSMLARLEVVLRHVGDDPELRVSELRSAGVDQRAELPPPVRRCVHDLFAERVAERPDALAVDADQRWTYRELDEVACGVAGRLGDFGVGPEVRVGVCAARSAMVPAAILGVLKAGGVCVPLDPALPAYLLRAMAEQYGLAVVLADERSEPVLSSASVPVVRLQRWPARPVTTAVTPADAAFVLPTAGDDPQAVVVEHQAFANSLRWQGIASWPMAGPLAWAATVFEILAPLTTGGALGAGTTLFDTPASIAEQHVAGRLPDAVRTIVTTGATPPASLVSALPHLDFVDLYATAETSVALVDGRPLDGVLAYVLDDRLRPVPPGCVGDLHIGGHGLARGYLDDPAATALRFRPDPFDPRRRIFATGDLARRDPDGTVHVVRRSGRVDLAAVESVLLAHPAVRRAHAFDGEDGVVAVAVVRQGMTAPDLRDWPARRLPRHTVPSTVRPVDALPVLPSGKPDRDGVLRLLAGTPEQAGEELPLTETERTVTRAWTSVLGRTVGVRENFFDAGGNSLLLVRLCEQLRVAFDRQVGVTDLFRHPTVRAMAEHLAGTAEQAAPDAAERGRARQEALRARGKARQHR